MNIARLPYEVNRDFSRFLFDKYQKKKLKKPKPARYFGIDFFKTRLFCLFLCAQAFRPDPLNEFTLKAKEFSY